MPCTRLVADSTINWTDTAPYLLGIFNLRMEYIQASKQNLYDSQDTYFVRIISSPSKKISNLRVKDHLAEII